MKTLVVLAIFGVCAAFAQFTPEVQEARNRFFEAYRAAERAANPDSYTPEVREARNRFFKAFRAAERAASPAGSPYQPKWTGPFASSKPAGLPGSPDQVPFTAEVQAAANAFERAYQKQLEAVSRN